MNGTAQFAVLAAAAVIFTAPGNGAEEPKAPAQQAASSSAAVPAPSGVSLTNKAVVLIAKLRGVEATQIKIRASSHRAGGAFEIDISGAKDAAKEAEELSKALGSAAAVILEHVSDDGVIRTNWTFRSGNVRQLTAPVGNSGLAPKARRMYVWPESSVRPPSAPSKVRVREQTSK